MKICIEFTPDEILRASKAGMLEALFEVTKSETERNREQGAQKTDPEELPWADNPKTEPAAESENEPEEISLEEVRAAFVAKNSKANAPKLRAILAKFKVKKVTDLDPADYPEALKELEAI